jgi:hypothetical protein
MRAKPQLMKATRGQMLGSTSCDVTRRRMKYPYLASNRTWK